ITTTAEVPSRNPIALETDTPKPIVTLFYSKKPRKSKTTDLVSRSKVTKSVSANKKETSKSWRSTVFNVPSSSLDECRIDNESEFVNQTLREYYEMVGISHETSVARSSQQNGVVERRNRTLIEAARTISLEPALHEMTPATISSRLVPNPPPSTSFVPPSRTDWDLLFQPLFD
nr:retrotransposon protein, putative, Ty1-copia subclass [Tanacetum cinerariifolium]